jgi:hypothetical protein
MLGADLRVRFPPPPHRPVLVLAGSRSALLRAHQRARERGLQLAIYSDGMFATGDDVSNRVVVAARPTADLDLVGLATWGDRKAVDKSFDGLRLHP